MTTTYHPPAYSPQEAAQHATFTALMSALSLPGRLYDLPQGDAFTLIADALLDLETSYYTPSAALAQHLARTGARALTPDTAAYHFYPAGLLEMRALMQAHAGDMLYPDTAATLIISCAFNLGEAAEKLWTGPGIKGVHHSTLLLPAEFWQARARFSYPLGWDVLLTDGRRVIGLPRTTRVTDVTEEG